MIRTNFFSIAIGLVVVSPVFGSSQAERAEKVLEGFDEIVRTGMKEFQVPGLSIGIVADGEVVYVKAFGEREKENALPATIDTLFPVGSCTKAFASFAVGGLVEEGLLDWDQRVIDILHEFRLWDPYATQNLTVRDLLCHRSGLPRHETMWYNSDFTTQEILSRLRYLEPTCAIRERFNYNNLMYVVLGMAMERSAQMSWEELIRSKILLPLGMANTCFSTREMETKSDYALPYLGKGDGLVRMPLKDKALIGPAGSICSSARDMCNWLKLQIDGGVWQGEPLIGVSTLKEMHSPQVVVSGYPESKEARVSAYGLGWCVQTYRGSYNVSHDGGPPGYTSLVSILPQERLGVVILSNKNLTPLPRILSMHALDLLLDLPQVDWLEEGIEGIKKNQDALQEEKKSEDLSRKKGTVPSHPLEEFEGVYEHPGYGHLEVSLEEGKLQAKFHHITYHLSHWHYDVFSVDSLSEEMILSREGLKFSFFSNLNGDIDTLSIPFESNAPDIVFKKKPEARHESLAYLRQFQGTYEIYGYSFDIVVKNHTLFSIIPGQPVYELAPGAENEFTVKSQTGYLVRFVTSLAGEIDEVLLIQPYGIVYSAKKKRP